MDNGVNASFTLHHIIFRLIYIKDDSREKVRDRFLNFLEKDSFQIQKWFFCTKSEAYSEHFVHCKRVLTNVVSRVYDLNLMEATAEVIRIDRRPVSSEE